MDTHNNNPTPNNKTLPPQTPLPVQPLSTTKQQTKQNINVTDIDAKALLAIQNFQSAQPKRKHGSKLILICLALLVLLVLVGYLLSALKPHSNSNASNSSNGIGIPNQTNNYSGNGTTNQINRDVNSCS